MTQRHILLVGLPGSGKTTVGRLVAQKLATGFVDFDQVLVRKVSRLSNYVQFFYLMEDYTEATTQGWY